LLLRNREPISTSPALFDASERKKLSSSLIQADIPCRFAKRLRSPVKDMLLPEYSTCSSLIVKSSVIGFRETRRNKTSSILAHPLINSVLIILKAGAKCNERLKLTKPKVRRIKIGHQSKIALMSAINKDEVPAIKHSR
jgi:hypothetical protein